MANLKDIRKRISSVKSTQQITKAMKMVAAAKLRRAQENIEAARPYAEKINQVVKNLAERTEVREHPLLVEREIQRRHLVLMTSDRGLCGGFNSNLIRAAERYLFDHRDDGVEPPSLTLIGRKGFDYFRRRGRNIRNSYIGLGGNYDSAVLEQITQGLLEGYTSGVFDSVTVIFSEFVSPITQKPVVMDILPITLPEREGPELVIDYLYEPSPEAILNDILPASVESQIWRALLDTTASEHGARMSAMEAATTNAADMIERLTLQYNRARQEAITKELMDIVGGAEALHG